MLKLLLFLFAPKPFPLCVDVEDDDKFELFTAGFGVNTDSNAFGFMELGVGLLVVLRVRRDVVGPALLLFELVVLVGKFFPGTLFGEVSGCSGTPPALGG